MLNRLTELAVDSRVARRTGTDVRVDCVGTGTAVLTRIAQTTVHICVTSHTLLRARTCNSRSQTDRWRGSKMLERIDPMLPRSMQSEPVQQHCTGAFYSEREKN